jgi:hypothetical protein
MAVAKYADRVTATKVASGTWDGIRSVNLALDMADERAIHIQGPDPEEGVCMVLSPSEQCAYDAFTELKLTRDALLVRFTAEGRRTFGVPSVRIDFDINDREWQQMSRVLGTICADKDYYSCAGGRLTGR